MQIRRLLGGYSLSGHLGRFRVTSWSPIYTWNTRFRCSTRSFRRNDIGRRLIDGRGKSGTLTLIGWPNAGDPHVSIPSAKSEERIFVVFLLVSPSERPDVANSSRYAMYMTGNAKARTFRRRPRNWCSQSRQCGCSPNRLVCYRRSTFTRTRRRWAVIDSTSFTVDGFLK